MYQFVTPYKELIGKLNELEKSCKVLQEKDKIKPDKYVLNEVLTEWDQEVINCVKEGLSPAPESILSEFKKYSHSGLHERIKLSDYLDNEKSFRQELKWFIDLELQALEKLKNYLFILKDVQQKDLSKVITIEEKLDYLLDELYLVFDGNHYSIKVLLDIGGIPYREIEPKELSKELKRSGYVRDESSFKSGYSEEFVCLTGKGASYVEQKRNGEDKEKGSEEVREKLDEILYKLEKLGHGQEIIFNELDTNKLPLGGYYYSVIGVIKSKLNKGEEITDEILSWIINPPPVIAATKGKDSDKLVMELTKEHEKNKPKSLKIVRYIKKELYEFICTDSEFYKKERASLGNNINVFIAGISSAIASRTSFDIGITTSIVTLIIMMSGKASKRALCEYIKPQEDID